MASIEINPDYCRGYRAGLVDGQQKAMDILTKLVANRMESSMPVLEAGVYPIKDEEPVIALLNDMLEHYRGFTCQKGTAIYNRINKVLTQLKAKA